ncbi:Rne/Rng family ribonuclease [[Mycobacterium] burgundiense]|uniref:Rne/Rng family ribonuclease n=1 Tax=[Mycobacterium] burgundiense TaxID=3064286 RepID=UPI00359F395B
MDHDAQIHDDTDHDPAASAAAAEPPELPEKLRVHSLARVLGTTSRRVLDALIEFDGRSRSAHSSVDRADAVRVRDLLAAADTAEPAAASAPAAAVTPEPSAAVEPEIVAPEFAEPEAAAIADPTPPTEEPESRLLLETPEPAADATQVVADYLPLFVAPQPVPSRRVERSEPAGVDDADTDHDDHDDHDEQSDDSGDDSSDQDDADDQSERPTNRRRRRGRRGRGRGRGGESAGDSDDDDEHDGDKSDDDSEDDSSAEDDGSDDDNSDDDSSDDDNGPSDGATRRRRRRRRRKSGSSDDSDNGSPDDPPNTVVHERAPRDRNKSDSDEIQGISGSTRLEAKRQRRRDGRDAGRRRPPILSEAEFLARRESVERVMVVRDKVRTEAPQPGSRYTQIAVLEDGVLVEHFVTSAGSASLVGNIYLGIVQNVLPSMEAAFVDIGRGRNGVLYAGEVNWEAAGLGGANRKIEQALKPGDYVVVQVSKDPVGHKGARLTTQVSLAGRYLVYVPGASSTGISRKLPDTERQRLKEILREIVPPEAGVIIRTASEGVNEEGIRDDVTRLQERWTQIEATAIETKKKAAGAAVPLYEEPDVLLKVIRDLFNEDFSNLVVAGDSAWNTINDYVNSVAPELLPKLTKYEGAEDGPDVFAVHRIDEQLVKAMDRKVWLPSGGTLVIDRTEAMTVVDVNTGKFTGAGGNLEQTVTKNNLEAAEEIVRQLRLRDIGGMIVIDFIDMVLEANRDLVLRRLTEALARDRTRHQVSEVTSLGLVQLTRKKLGTGLIEAFSTTCTHCTGTGLVMHADPVDSAPAAGSRRSDSGGGTGGGSSRRGRRGKKGRTEEVVPVVAKVPAHTAGEHPMFKAMAEKDEDEDDTKDQTSALDETDELDEDEPATDGVDVAAVTEDATGEDLEDDEDVEDVEDEIDLDDDESDDDEFDDIELDDDDDDDDDDDSDEDDSEDDDSEDDDSDEDEDDDEVAARVGRPRRRRAAARPAGPPS